MPGTERDDWIDEPTNIPEDWEIGGPALEVEDGDDDQLIQRLVEWAAVLRRVGGVVSCAAVRKEVAPEHYLTVGFAFKWDSFAPTERLNSSSDPRPIREQVYERDGHQCVECGTTENLTLDHIHPKSRGGKTTLDNLQTMCESCNRAKGNRVDGSRRRKPRHEHASDDAVAAEAEQLDEPLTEDEEDDLYEGEHERHRDPADVLQGSA